MRSDFSRLKRKIIFSIILISVLAFIVAISFKVLLIDGVLQEPFADYFVRFCQNVLGLSFDSARALYFTLFQQNKAVLEMIGFSIILLICFYFGLSRFTRYFNEISSGLDCLVAETEGEITLSPEMDFMTQKLNKIKDTLAKRQRDAREAEQRKNDLVVYLAHDIKTPLTSVIGYLNLLEEAPDLPQEQRAKYVTITLGKAYRLEQLIDEFFEITRFNLQAIVLNKGVINLPFMLRQMADEFYPMLSSQEKQVVVNAPEGLTLWGDADKLARVFNNILKNAVAYSLENSVIDISAQRLDEGIVITITNQGNQIPQHMLSTIFEKFYRLDSSRPTDKGGAGLGLAIAKEIVAAHGGTITAESNQEYTRFTVILPDFKAEIREA